MIEKIKLNRIYLKDLIVLIILIFLALNFYDKPSVNIHDLNKSKPNNFKEEGKKDESEKIDSDSSAIKKQLSLFKEEIENEEQETKQPTFEEVLFSKGYDNIKLIAITGTEKNKKALVVDHMNNLRIFKKGEKIDSNIIVLDISNVSIKFKSKSRVKELFLYKRDENIRETKKEIQPPVMRQQPKQEEIIHDQEPTEEETVEKMKKPRREIIR